VLNVPAASLRQRVGRNRSVKPPICIPSLYLTLRHQSMGTYLTQVDVSCRTLVRSRVGAEMLRRPKRALIVDVPIELDGANGPTLPQADDILAERGIRWCPMSSATPVASPSATSNGGGLLQLLLSEDEINLRARQDRRRCAEAHLETAGRHNVTLRTAAFIVACERILMARQERGLYP